MLEESKLEKTKIKQKNKTTSDTFRRLTEAQTDQNFDEENLGEMRRGGYDGLDRIEFVMHRRGRASEMVDVVDLQHERLHDVMADELELRVTKVVHHILLPSREQIVHHNHSVAAQDELVDQMAPYESRPARHNNPQRPPPQP